MVPLIKENDSQVYGLGHHGKLCDREEIKKALLALFLYFAPTGYLDNGCRIDVMGIAGIFPDNSCWAIFTPHETSEMVREQERRSLTGVL